MVTEEERHDSPARSENHTALIRWTPEQQRVLSELGFEGDLIVEGPRGQDHINPLLLARIAERISFDGDLPVLRTGPLPEGGSPAVPVTTDAVDLVVIGDQLRRASQEVGMDLQLAQEAMNRHETEGIVQKNDALPVALGASVFGYGPGVQPFPRRVPERVVCTNFRDSQTLAWASIATTQGRETLARVVERLLAESLCCDIGGVSGAIQEAHWMQRLGESSEVNPRFNLVHTIVGSMKRQLQGHRFRSLHVEAIHAVHLRRVGFVCKAALAE